MNFELCYQKMLYPLSKDKTFLLFYYVKRNADVQLSNNLFYSIRTLKRSWTLLTKEWSIGASDQCHVSKQSLVRPFRTFSTHCRSFPKLCLSRWTGKCFQEISPCLTTYMPWNGYPNMLLFVSIIMIQRALRCDD